MNTVLPAPLIEAASLSISFNGSAVLSSVDFDVAAGEIHALVGENGAGKSSLMKMLGGLYRPDSGTIRVRGVPTRLANVNDAIDAGIAIIHQELNLVDTLSAVDNIFLGKELRTRLGFPDRRAMRAAARGVLDQLGFRADPETLVGTLRVGEKQLVEIAKSLVADAKVLIMDEPTSALSDAETHALLTLTRRLRERGMGIVLISHRLSEVFAVADRVTVLRDGRRILTLPLAQIESSTALVSMMIGKDFVPPERGAEEAPHMRDTSVDVRNLTLRGAARALVRDVSFSVLEGEVFGLSGLLGAGKTEVLEAIYGISAYTREGSIVVAGQHRSFRSPDEAAAAGLAFVTEDRKKDGLVLDQSLEANFVLPSLPRVPGFPFYWRRRLHGWVAEQARASRVKHRSLTQSANSLSGGNQQKLIIGKWLMTNPRILLLDEPTRGVDVAAKAEIYRQILGAARAGVTVLIASSEIDELTLLCDRILVLCEGRAKDILRRSDFSGEVLIRLASP
ncbi:MULTISPECIES: sugar ABC transporter ATP-binding protein [Paraburkholderia]|uniref:Sugar ABC transporter ATP-binding protein n=1 Tax=Paraburkholderia podalyriae TaxID=1938811 RepID=A0ABR7PNB0_9BURK|nr:sugar ABC transporter ATP-binding protein [Paraburkholderia podalyriae]MBC8747428.1 sugar ABC transporter ATP-binding protein [Paraburkholderia podalyriae]